jgi:endonuclease G
MKKIFFVTFMMTTLFAACNAPAPEVEKTPDNPQEVRFSTNVTPMTRLNSETNTWDQHDILGVFMTPAGSDINEFRTTNNANHNVPYRFESDWSLYTLNDPIMYPSDGSKVDFIAYYPHRSHVGIVLDEEVNLYGVDLSYYLNQEFGFALVPELLYSNNAKNITLSNNVVNLDFKYVFAKVVVTVTATEASALEASHFATMKVAMDSDSAPQTGYLDLATGEVVETDEEGYQKELRRVANTATSATFEALIIPSAEPHDIKFTFDINGTKYSKTMANQAILTGNQYNMPFELDIDSPNPITFVSNSATITARTVNNLPKQTVVRDYSPIL